MRPGFDRKKTMRSRFRLTSVLVAFGLTDMFAGSIVTGLRAIPGKLGAFFARFWKRIAIVTAILLGAAVLGIGGLIFYMGLSKCVSGNCQDGAGTIRYNDGTIYSGRFREGKFDGPGTLLTRRKGNYRGDWVMGKKQGFGEYSYADGGKYSGEFYDNLKQGRGSYRWSDGTVLSGNWFRGEPQGDCTLTLADGTALKGQYKDGKVHSGAGIYIYDNGTRYVGQWSEGQRNGIGALVDEEGGVIFSGRWKDDKEVKTDGK